MIFRGIADVFKAAAVNWVNDYAQSMGAALAFYTMFSIAPLLLIVISIAGAVFGEAAARGEIFGQLEGLLGRPGASAVAGLAGWRRPSRPTARSRRHSGRSLLFIGATSVFAELQDALDRIWRAPQRNREVRTVGPGTCAAACPFGMILGIGFLLIVSLAFQCRAFRVEPVVRSASSGWLSLADTSRTRADRRLAHRGLRDDLQDDAQGARQLARRLGRRGGHVDAVRCRQAADRHLHRQERCLDRLWRGRFAGRRPAVGVLLGADLPVRRRVLPGRIATSSARARAGRCRLRCDNGNRGYRQTYPTPTSTS